MSKYKEGEPFGDRFGDKIPEVGTGQIKIPDTVNVQAALTSIMDTARNSLNEALGNMEGQGADITNQVNRAQYCYFKQIIISELLRGGHADRDRVKSDLMREGNNCVPLGGHNYEFSDQQFNEAFDRVHQQINEAIESSRAQ